MANKKIQLKDKDGNNLYPMLVKQCILDIVYPVGSIYISVNETNPGTLFGGTWEQIKDRFLLGTTNTPGTTGGSKTHNHGAGNLGACFDPSNDYSNACFRTIDLETSYNLKGYWRNTYSSGGGSSGVGIPVVGHTSTENNMPPYMEVYMWKRIA